jgi:hypothetical protein
LGKIIDGRNQGTNIQRSVPEKYTFSIDNNKFLQSKDEDQQSKQINEIKNRKDKPINKS